VRQPLAANCHAGVQHIAVCVHLGFFAWPLLQEGAKFCQYRQEERGWQSRRGLSSGDSIAPQTADGNAWQTPFRKKASGDLEELFRMQQCSTLDTESNVTYPNRDSDLMNVPPEPEKEGVEPPREVRFIEEEFKRLTFDVENV